MRKVRIISGSGIFALLAFLPGGLWAQDPCTSLCFYTCPFSKKIVTNGQPFNSTNPIDFECHWGTCNRGCGPDQNEEDVELVLASLDTGDAQAVAAWLVTTPSVHLNPHRRAIQVLSACNPGAVEVHIPIEEDMFARVSAAIPDEDKDNVLLPSLRDGIE